MKKQRKTEVSEVVMGTSTDDLYRKERQETPRSPDAGKSKVAEIYTTETRQV